MSQFSQGKDPRTTNDSPTLQEVLDDYCSYKTDRDMLSDDSAQQYRNVIDRHAPNLLKRQVTSIPVAKGAPLRGGQPDQISSYTITRAEAQDASKYQAVKAAAAKAGQPLTFVE